MVEAIAWVLLGLVLLYYGAESLVYGASTFALAMGLTPLIVGLTVVAYGTSLPELAVSVTASSKGQGAMAIGNVIGSNICNIGIVLGVAALCRQLVVTKETTHVYVPFMIASSFLVTFFLLDGELDRTEGFGLTVGIIAYTVFGIRRARAQVKRQREAEEGEVVQTPEDGPKVDEAEDQPVIEKTPIWKPLCMLFLGFALLLIGGRVLVSGAVVLAQQLGVSEVIIALTVVAFGTSAPDLAASAVAAMKGEGEMAAGNAIGSVIFNLLNVLGIAALVAPIDAGAIDRSDHIVQLCFIAASFPLLVIGFKMRRWQGGLCVAAYLGYVIYRWPA
ncbi:MAG: calcium/sodium antiporter [Limisphaerales bacterium]